jgi:hypothetical protein
MATTWLAEVFIVSPRSANMRTTHRESMKRVGIPASTA